MTPLSKNTYQSASEILPNFTLLTTVIYRAYYFAHVLNTHLEADYITPVSSDFFMPKVFLRSGGEQQYKTLTGNIAGRLLAVFKRPTAPNLNSWVSMNKLEGDQSC